MTRGRERLVRWAVTLGVLGALAALVLHAPRYRYHWHWFWFESAFPAAMLHGLVTTAWVSVLAMLLALALGLLGGLARLSRKPALHQLGTVYVELIRGTPLLVQLLVAYYCLAPALRDLFVSAGAPGAFAGLFDKGAFVGVLALGVFAGAYVTEIVRAAVESVDRGQTEAALSQGMTSGQVLRLVLLPQAFRRMIPPLTGEFVSLVKDSSLLSAIAVAELSKEADQARSNAHVTFEVLIPLALMYLAITFPLSRLARHLEHRLAP